MIFAMRSGREKIILSDLKNPPDRLKKHVPGNTQFMCHKKPKLKQYNMKSEKYFSKKNFMSPRFLPLRLKDTNFHKG